MIEEWYLWRRSLLHILWICIFFRFLFHCYNLFVCKLQVNYRLDQFSPASDTASSSSDYPDNIPKGCVTYFSPGTLQTKFNSGAINCHYHFRFVSPPSSGHLNKSKVQRVECLNKAISYLTFSPDGNELLVNMGAEQIYLYDVIGGNKPVVSSNLQSSTIWNVFGLRT